MGLYRPYAIIIFRTKRYAFSLELRWFPLLLSMVIYLAGMQGVPTHLYEACELDGAGAWRRFLHVTLPMTTPVIFSIS